MTESLIKLGIAVLALGLGGWIFKRNFRNQDQLGDGVEDAITDAMQDGGSANDFAFHFAFPILLVLVGVGLILNVFSGPKP